MSRLVELKPYPWASEVRRFRVDVPGHMGLVGCCIAPHPGDKRHDPRPPMVEVLISPGGVIRTADATEVRSLALVLEEAASWLEAQEPAEPRPSQLTFTDVDPPRPTIDVEPSEEVA